MKVIGLYRELEEDERFLQESADICEIYSKSGMGFWSWLKGEKPDTSFSKLFLTNKRMLFLSLFTGKLQDLKSGKANIQGLSANWVEIPLDTIISVETPPKISFNSVLSGLLFKREQEKRGELVLHLQSKHKQAQGWVSELLPKQTFSIIVENRDMWATNIENAIHHHKKSVGTGPRIDDSYRQICDICGAHYDQNTARFGQCKECGRWACRETQKGVIFKEWVPTNCYDDDLGVCRQCRQKG